MKSKITYALLLFILVVPYTMAQDRNLYLVAYNVDCRIHNEKFNKLGITCVSLSDSVTFKINSSLVIEDPITGAQIPVGLPTKTVGTYKLSDIVNRDNIASDNNYNYASEKATGYHQSKTGGIAGTTKANPKDSILLYSSIKQHISNFINDGNSYFTTDKDSTDCNIELDFIKEESLMTITNLSKYSLYFDVICTIENDAISIFSGDLDYRSTTVLNPGIKNTFYIDAEFMEDNQIYIILSNRTLTLNRLMKNYKTATNNIQTKNQNVHLILKRLNID